MVHDGTCISFKMVGLQFCKYIVIGVLCHLTSHSSRHAECRSTKVGPSRREQVSCTDVCLVVSAALHDGAQEGQGHHKDHQGEEHEAEPAQRLCCGMR